MPGGLGTDELRLHWTSWPLVHAAEEHISNWHEKATRSGVLDAQRHLPGAA